MVGTSGKEDWRNPARRSSQKAGTRCTDYTTEVVTNRLILKKGGLPACNVRAFVLYISQKYFF